jgi:hypothetical protein
MVPLAAKPQPATNCRYAAPTPSWAVTWNVTGHAGGERDLPSSYTRPPLTFTPFVTICSIEYQQPTVYFGKPSPCCGTFVST